MTKKHAQGKGRKRVTDRTLSEPITTKNLVQPAPNFIIDAGTLKGKRIVEKCFEQIKRRER